MNKKSGARAELARFTLQGWEWELPWKRDCGRQGIKPKYNMNEVLFQSDVIDCTTSARAPFTLSIASIFFWDDWKDRDDHMETSL